MFTMGAGKRHDVLSKAANHPISGEFLNADTNGSPLYHKGVSRRGSELGRERERERERGRGVSKIC